MKKQHTEMNISNLPLEQRVDFFMRRAHRRARAHSLAGKQCSRANIALGIPAVTISTIIASALFLSLIDDVPKQLTVWLGVFSIAAALLSAFQTFFRFSEKAQSHKNSASGYSSLYRKLSTLKLKCGEETSSTEILICEFSRISTEWDEIEKASLDVSDKLYDQAVKEQNDDEEGV